MRNEKILIVDDDLNLCQDIQEYFEGDFECKYAQSIEVASKLLDECDFALLILDVEIGTDNGIDYYSEARRQHVGPIIFLSGINDVNIRLNSYEMGADDFLVKPFDLTELLYKVRKIIERTNVSQSYQVDNFKVDLEHQKIFYKDVDLKLQLTPYKLLVYFLNNQDYELSREKIFNDVWEIDEEFTARQIDVNVSKLRKRVPGIEIENIWGKGYKFKIIEEKAK